MGLLTKGQIEALHPLPVVDVELERWGGSVRLRGMTVKEADDWSQRFKGKGDANAQDLRQKIFEQFAINEDGKPLGVSLEVLSRMDLESMETLLDEFLKLNGLAEGSAEELEGN